MTIIGSASTGPAARPTDDTIRLVATVAIRLAGALTVFAGLILTTQALIDAMIAMTYSQKLGLLGNVELNVGRLGVMTAFSTLGSALIVVVWGALLTALARPLGRFIVRVRY